MRKFLLPLCASVFLLFLSPITTHAEDAAKKPVAETPSTEAPAAAENPVVPTAPVAPKDIKAEIVGSPAIAPDNENTFKIKLTDETGNPITPERLDSDANKAIRLFINDQTLTDYYDIHPTPSGEAGTWSFVFYPCKVTSYKGWAKIKTTDGQERTTAIDFTGKTPCTKDCVFPRVVTEGEGGGIRATLVFNQPLKIGQELKGAIHLTDQISGKPVTDLEPLKGEFAQIVGFFDDFNTMTHIEPDGENPKDETSRGGADISFSFKPERTGFVQLFLQMRRGGKDVYIPFGVTVE